ncbi:MAG: hypothetical protein AAFN78_07940 [Pseudomonadota bacterium]
MAKRSLPRAVLLAWTLFATGLLLGGACRAEMVEIDDAQLNVVFDEVQFIEGSQGIVSQFEITSPGTYLARLTDYEFPEAFDQLALTLVSGTTTIGTLGEAGAFEFQVSQPGQFFAIVFGVTSSTAGLGLFGVQIADIARVPLPAGIVLLFSALALLRLRRAVPPSITA